MRARSLTSCTYNHQGTTIYTESRIVAHRHPVLVCGVSDFSKPRAMCWLEKEIQKWQVNRTNISAVNAASLSGRPAN